MGRRYHRNNTVSIAKYILYAFILPIALIIFYIKNIIKIFDKYNPKYKVNYVILVIVSIILVVLGIIGLCQDTKTNSRFFIGLIAFNVLALIPTTIYIIKRINQDNYQKEYNTNNYYNEDNNCFDNNYTTINDINISKQSNTDKTYTAKDNFMTNCEKSYFNVFREILGNKYILQPQVNLATVVNKENCKYQNELFRNIDFGVFDLNYKLLFLIEINDKTHQEYARMERDSKVKSICESANIPLVTFWTSYDINKEYIKKRFLEYIELDVENDVNTVNEQNTEIANV